MVVLAQGMTMEALPHEDAPEVGVAVEADAHQIPHFALLKIGTRPHGDQ